ncbi:MAG: hypothetical protein Q9163_003301 [Psora crenata]
MAPSIIFILGLASLVYRVSATCDCYRTDTGDYYANHEFIDFRNFEQVFDKLEVPSYHGNNYMTRQNVIRHPDHLQLLTHNNGSQFSAEIDSKEPVLYGSFRAEFQVTGEPGGVAGFFLYRDGGSNEQDIEILTNEATDQIQCVSVEIE